MRSRNAVPATYRRLSVTRPRKSPAPCAPRLRPARHWPHPSMWIPSTADRAGIGRGVSSTLIPPPSRHEPPADRATSARALPALDHVAVVRSARTRMGAISKMRGLPGKDVGAFTPCQVVQADLFGPAPPRPSAAPPGVGEAQVVGARHQDDQVERLVCLRSAGRRCRSVRAHGVVKHGWYATRSCLPQHLPALAQQPPGTPSSARPARGAPPIARRIAPRCWNPRSTEWRRIFVSSLSCDFRRKAHRALRDSAARARGPRAGPPSGALEQARSRFLAFSSGPPARRFHGVFPRG